MLHVCLRWKIKHTAKWTQPTTLSPNIMCTFLCLFNLDWKESAFLVYPTLFLCQQLLFNMKAPETHQVFNLHQETSLVLLPSTFLHELWIAWKMHRFGFEEKCWRQSAFWEPENEAVWWWSWWTIGSAFLFLNNRRKLNVLNKNSNYRIPYWK